GADTNHILVVQRLVIDISRGVLFLKAADAMFEAGSTRHSPRARQSVRIAFVWQEADWVGRKFHREVRDIFQLGYSPRLGTVCKVTVRENNYRHHVLDSDAAGFNGHPEAVCWCCCSQHRNGRLGVAAEERLQQVRLLSFGRKAG